VYRNLYKSLQSHLPKKEFIILTGARQTGKSTLLRQLESECATTGTPSLFLNLENKAILQELDSGPLNLLQFLPATDKRVIVFVDEVQYLKDPSNFMKLLYDEHAEKLKIVATGSSAFYLDDRFRDSLAGRKKVFQLYTCSFGEYLRLSDKEDLLEEMERIAARKNAKTTRIAYLRSEWENYMIYGGYPAVVKEEDLQEKAEMLKEIRDSYVKRDILEAGVQDEIAFYNLFRIIAGQSGGLLNVNELSSTLRIKNETVNNYLHILQKCFHIALVRPFSRNLRKELVKMPKAYLLDTGLRNSLINNFQRMAQRFDRGELWENMVSCLLIDQYGQEDIHFWRTADGNEVDFVMPDTTSPCALEVKYDEVQIRYSKYKKFQQWYPEIPLQFAWMEPFDEEFFRRMGLGNG
jgi:uncharacterized protein